MKIFLTISSKIKGVKDGAKNFLIGQMKKPVNTKHPMKKIFGLFCIAKGHFGVINVTQHALNTVSNSMESKMYGINPGKIKKNKKGDSQLYAHTTIKRFVPARTHATPHNGKKKNILATQNETFFPIEGDELILGKNLQKLIFGGYL